MGDSLVSALRSDAELLRKGKGMRFVVGIFAVAITVCGIPALLIGCGGRGEERPAAKSARGTDTTVWVSERGIVLVPTSRVLLSLLEKHKVAYIEDLVALNFSSREVSVPPKEALALGVYSVDALYLIYGKNREAIQHCFSRMEVAAAALGIRDELQLDEVAKASGTVTALEELLPLIGRRIARLGRALRRQGHEDYYALVAAGAWVESTRLLSCIALTNRQEELYRLVAEQRFLLSEVCELLSGYVYSHPVVEELYNQLSTINGVYGGVQISYSYGAVETDTARHFSKIHALMQVAMSRAQLEAIKNSLEVARDVMMGER